MSQTAECQKRPVDIVFVFDSSQSVEEVFEQQKQVADRLISHLNIDPFGSLVGLVEYSRYNKLLLPISTAQHIDQVKEAFNKLRHIGGYTLTADAVKTGVDEMHQGGRPGAERLFVLITDGHSFNKWSDVLETADSLHNTGAKVIIIALADSLYMPELIEYGGPQGMIFTRQNVSQVDSVFIDLTSNGCKPESSWPSSDEDCATDILFILDGSGNASDSFKAKKQFVKSVINELTIRPTAHRVALIEFSDINRQKELFNFASYSDKASVLNAVDSATFLGRALTFSQNTIKRRRKNVRLIIFVVSDGLTYDDAAEPARALRELPNTHVVAVGFTQPTDKPELVLITGSANLTFSYCDLDKVKQQVLGSHLNCAGAPEAKYERPEEEYEPEKVAEGDEAQSLAVHKVAAPFPTEDFEKYYKGATGKGSCDETNGPSNVIILLDSSKSIRSVESRREAAMQLIFKLLNGHLNVQVTVAQHPSLQGAERLRERLSSYADNCQIRQTKPDVTRKSASVVYITSESTAESLAANLSHFSAPNLNTYFLTTESDDSTSSEIRKPSKPGLIFPKCNVGALYEEMLKNATCLPN
ncbi:von Willebrand factor type A domain protein [Trichuris suis]|nr:von Willebrand factor type A domain protein [Trichuris suis]